jgi:flagellar biosynthetic protein FliP
VSRPFLARAARAVFLAVLVLLCLARPARAQDVPGLPEPAPVAAPDPAARVTVEIPGSAQKGDMSTAVKIAIGLTALTLLPALLMTATGFLRIVIVLGFVRTGLATQTMPPNQVILGLALILTLLAMGPVLDKVWDDAASPYMKGEIDADVALKRAEPTMRAFLLRHTRTRDLATFVEIARIPAPVTPEKAPLRVLLPAYVTSELTTAFEMGVVILLPFAVIDLVVSSVLLALGLMMLPPATIAGPMKLLLFVLVDGWVLVCRALVLSAG